MYTTQVRTNQCLDEDMLSEYMDFLTKEQGIEACLLFFNYCMGLHSKFLFLSVLYHSYKNDFDEVNKFEIAQCLCKWALQFLVLSKREYLPRIFLLLSFGLRLFEQIRFRLIRKLGKQNILDFSEKPVLLFKANCTNFFIFENIAGFFMK